MVQWLRLCASSAEGVGLITGQGTRIPHATGHDQKGKKKTPQTLKKKIVGASKPPCPDLIP